MGILVLSGHVEIEHATELLATGHRIGYLLKGRVLDVDEFVDSLRRIAAGGSVVDPGLVQTLVQARRGDDPLGDLTAREREVLALMAEGRSNAGIAGQLWLAEGTVEKHIRHILAKLRLPETRDDHRRVLAVVTFLKSSKEPFSLGCRTPRESPPPTAASSGRSRALGSSRSGARDRLRSASRRGSPSNAQPTCCSAAA